MSLNWGTAVALIPGLISLGKASEALEDYHVISTVAIPLLGDPEAFTSWSKASVLLAAASKDGRLAEVNDAVYSLGKIAIALLSDPNHSAAAMAFINSLVATPDDTEPNAPRSR